MQNHNIRLPKILFSLRDDWRQSIISNLDRSKYEIEFALFDDNLHFEEYDLVIPLTISDLLFLNCKKNIAIKNFFIPSKESILMADNKFEFNSFLSNNSFGQFIPPPLNPGQYPYILKKKIGGFGKDCYIIRNEEDELKYSEFISDTKNYFSQTLIHGNEEFTTHIFFYKNIVFHVTYQFVYSQSNYIKGCNSEGISSNVINTPFLEIWHEILTLMKYEGLGCFNYKIIDNKPVIFEFNPRFGSSLTREITSIIDIQLDIFKSISMIELSVVVLCYHSGRTILPFFHLLEKLLDNLQIEYEIILVANDFESSKDETIQIVKDLSNNRPRVKPITKIKEGMMGWDMLQGMNACEGNFICVIDGDGQFPIESIQSIYKIIKNENYDLVKTYRKKRHDGYYRFLVSKIYNFTFNILYPGLNSLDVNSKPKIFTREVYHKMNLQSTDWFIDAEIMITARKLKLKLKEIAIEFYENENRKSFVKFVAIIEFILNLIKFKFRKI